MRSGLLRLRQCVQEHRVASRVQSQLVSTRRAPSPLLGPAAPAHGVASATRAEFGGAGRGFLIALDASATPVRYSPALLDRCASLERTRSHAQWNWRSINILNVIN